MRRRRDPARGSESGAVPLIELVDVHKTYTTDGAPYEAVRGVSLQVETGEFLAIIGPSGCGKTTLLNLIGGLDRPTSGSVKVKELELQSASDDDLAEHRRCNVGFVFQSFFLSPRRTALENVMLALHFGPRSARERVPDAERALDAVGLGALKSRPCANLSGGQRQRVAIARALVSRPPILLADEPIGHLDNETAQEVLRMLHDYQKEAQATVLVVTHEESLVEAASRVLTMKEGKLL